MIYVRFETSEDKKTIVLKLQGHAGQAELGKDIVCASATILAYTVAQVVADLHDRGKLKKKPTVTLKEGDIAVVCKPTKDAYAQAMHTYAVAQVGYALLANTYPEYVKLTPFGKGGCS